MIYFKEISKVLKIKEQAPKIKNKNFKGVWTQF